VVTGQRRQSIAGDPCWVLRLGDDTTEVAVRERDLAIVRISRLDVAHRWPPRSRARAERRSFYFWSVFYEPAMIVDAP
jgi:hypothetical protein